MWVIVALAALAGLIVLVLSVPLDAALNMDASARPRFRLRLVWLFGLVNKELSKKEKKHEEKKEVTREKRRKKRRIGFRTILRILRTKGLLKQVKNLVKGVLGQLKIKELAVNLELGLDDPADTGFLFALIESTRPFVSSTSRYRIRVQPSFQEEAVFEGNLHGILRLRPIMLVWPVLRFVFSLAVLRAAKTLVLSRWKGKK